MNGVITNSFIIVIIFYNTLLCATVLDNVAENGVDISQNHYYNIKEHTIEHVASGGRVQKDGIDVFKDDIYWIKNGTNKVISLNEEEYKKIKENGTVLWKNGEQIILQIPEDFYSYLVTEHFVSAIQTESKNFSHDGCSCVNSTICECCMHITDIEFIHDQICVGLQLVREDLGLKAFLIIGNITYSQEISVKNPPPLCVLNIYKELKICMKVYDIDTSFKTLHGCLAVAFQIYRMPLVYVRLGCITAFDGLPAPIDHCSAHISASSVDLTCIEKTGQKADFFILHLQQNSNIIKTKTCNAPDFNITSLKAQTFYDISITPAVVKENGSSFRFSLNTSIRDGEDFDKIFVNSMASLVVQSQATIFIICILSVTTYLLV